MEKNLKIGILRETRNPPDRRIPLAPRDTSYDFGKQLMHNVMHDLFTDPDSPVIGRATILKDGKLTTAFSYLSDYLND